MKSLASHNPTKLKDLEFRVLRRLNESGIELRGKKIVVACSGGLDSMALALCLARIGKRLGFELVLGHVHHGATLDTGTAEGLLESRNRAFRVVSREARKWGLDVRGLRRRLDLAPLRSEDSLREFRLRALRVIAASVGAHFVAYAHHRDDLLETRLIRLVRGTGPDGLRSMKLVRGRALRPFLFERRDAVLSYAKENEIEWHEDPTNGDDEPLRNWIRNSWLPALEAKRRGGKEALTRSLESIVERLDVAEASYHERDEALSLTTLEKDASGALVIDRSRYLQLGIVERRRLLARALRESKVACFSSAHLDEIRKRVESCRIPKRESRRFHLLKVDFEVNAQQIRLVLRAT